MSTGLLASTVTPGSTAPVASLTIPANALCARAVDGSARQTSTAVAIAKRLLVMRILPHSKVNKTTERLSHRHNRANIKGTKKRAVSDRFRKVGSTRACSKMTLVGRRHAEWLARLIQVDA